MKETLNQKLLTAHETNDVPSLIGLYTMAGDEKERDGDIDAACFFLTHAFIYALEHGDERVRELNQRLVTYGRSPDLPA